MKLENFLFEPLIPHHQIEYPIQQEKIFESKAPLDVEIGSGTGEYLLKRAIDFPGRNIVGIEQIWERVIRTLSFIEKFQMNDKSGKGLKNIKLLKMDAYVAFKSIFPKNSIENVFCLFPCPWPKKAHARYRLFSRDFLLLINKCLKKKGMIKIVTDYYPYFEWILEQSDNTGFNIITDEIDPRYDTKFERKWIREGQREFFEINMFKEKSVSFEKDKEISLKSYKIKKFDPKKFLWKDKKGDVSVIFKELIFDSDQKKCMIRLVVSEQNITQHFWVSIIKKGDHWKICKSAGQSFLPTPGIIESLNMVYESASGINKN